MARLLLIGLMKEKTKNSQAKVFIAPLTCVLFGQVDNRDRIRGHRSSWVGICLFDGFSIVNPFYLGSRITPCLAFKSY